MPFEPLDFGESLDMEHAVDPWKSEPQKIFVFTNAHIIDPKDGSVTQNATIRLENGTITSINDEKQQDTGSGTIHVDLEGKYIIPGLWDAHVHMVAVQGGSTLAEMFSLSKPVNLLRQPDLGRMILDKGFTTVRDTGGALLPLKQAFEKGIHPGPRLFIAGHALSQTNGHGDFRSPFDDHQCCGGHTQVGTRIVDGVPQCLKFAREELRQGADFLKIMCGGGVASPTDAIEHLQFTEEEIRAITTVAKNAGTYVTAHAYTAEAITQAIHCGVLGIEHGNLLDRPTAELMAAKGAFLTPTLVINATFGSKEFSNFLTPYSKKKNAEVLDAGLRAIKIASDAGVTLCYGTDLLGPMHLAQTKEFEIRSRVLEPLQILQSATINPARMMKVDKKIGRIVPGYIADLLILNANPLEDIRVLDRPEKHLLAVFKEGRVVSSRWGRLEEEGHRRPVKIA
jgi:imidazolonepropionase-like amidohydrolase